jgi:hypothetical protein
MKNNARENEVQVGAHCRAQWNIRTAQGLIRQGTRGTVREEQRGTLKRRLVWVDWENGLSTVVPLADITVLRRVK